MSETVWIMNARLAFADNVFEKKGIASDPSSTPRYGCGLLLSPKDKQIAEIEKIMEDMVSEFDFKGDADSDTIYKMMKKKDRLALHDGDDKPNLSGYPGSFYLSPSSDTRPTVVDRDRTPLTKDDGRIYSGCYVNAQVELWVQDNKWGQRVNATLLGIQFVKDGDAFGSGSPPANPDDFPDLDADGDDDGLLD